MKRAEVWRDGDWLVAVWDGEIPDRRTPIPARDPGGRYPDLGGGFPTHEEALRFALAEVGLTEKTGHES